jgi:signal transduction histidine kinase
VHEDACVGWGDPACELHFRWYVGRSWGRVVIGAVLFGALGLLLQRLHFLLSPTPVLLAALGAAVAHALEGRRAERFNAATRQSVIDALRLVAMDEAELRREALELGQRQKEWTRLVEEEMSSRSAALRALVARVKEMHDAHATKVLGFSHDLRNPLQVILASTRYLEESPPVVADATCAEWVRDIAQSAQRMRAMLSDLGRAAKSQREFVTMDPQRIETASMADDLRRRLHALVYGRDVRVTVCATPKTPEDVWVDPAAFDRIVDNLLANAARSTEHGSIAVELGGMPGLLAIKVSDTGKSLAPEEMQRIFQPGAPILESRRGDGFGVGLSIVVQLLDQMGGRLEVTSKPGQGTTCCVYLPLEPPSSPVSGPQAPAGRATEAAAKAQARVVTVR